MKVPEDMSEKNYLSILQEIQNLKKETLTTIYCAKEEIISVIYIQLSEFIIIT